MIHVFCNKKGSGKTKALVSLANDKVLKAKGNLVYVDDDRRMVFELDRKIRFICAEDFKVDNAKDFYGFLCGMIAQDYDIEAIMIDGVMNGVISSLEEMKKLFYKIEYLTQEFNVEFFINISGDPRQLPDEIKRYIS
ncbi:hypothetical protein [Clostridium sp. Marseille-QA1073]